MAAKGIDEALIEQIQQGNEQAFGLLYKAYFAYLCSCAHSYIFNFDDSQDIVNEVFVKVWYHRETLEYPVQPYLVKAVQNGCLNYLRSLHGQDKHMDEYRKMVLEFQEEQCSDDCTPLSLLEQQELEQEVLAIVHSLPEKCRAIFESYLYGGKSPQEIADENGLSVNTVRVQIKRGMDKLREMLGSRFGFLLCFLF